MMSENSEQLPPVDVPAVQVVKGTPDDEELAALVAGLMATAVPPEDAEPARGNTSVWNDASRRWGGHPRPSRSAWRWSAHRVW